MNEFLPLADYDYTFLGGQPEEWIGEYVTDLDVDEYDDDMFDLLIEEEV
jgi:hypothetical protein